MIPCCYYIVRVRGTRPELGYRESRLLHHGAHERCRPRGRLLGPNRHCLGPRHFANVGVSAAVSSAPRGNRAPIVVHDWTKARSLFLATSVFNLSTTTVTKNNAKSVVCRHLRDHASPEDPLLFHQSNESFQAFNCNGRGQHALSRGRRNNGCT